MKVDIDQATLSTLISRTQGIVDRRSTVPMLANVLIDATEADRIAVSATDYDLYMQGSCDARVIKKGKVCINARDFNEIIKNLPSGMVTLAQDKAGSLAITTGSIQYKIHAAPPDDFPSLPNLEEVSYFQIDPSDILDIISHTIFAVASDDPRIFLNGAFVELQEDKHIRMVGTDGHRLAKIERSLEKVPKLDHSVIIPRKGLNEMTKLLGEGISEDEKVELGFSNTNAHLRRKGLSLIIRLIEGEFPDYKMVIPKASGNIATVPRRALIDALRRVSLLSVERTFGVKMKFSAGSMMIESSHPDKGESKEVLDVDYDKDKDELTVGFNAKFFLDALAVIESDDVKLELSDELSPCVVHPSDNEEYICVIMPVRVS